MNEKPNGKTPEQGNPEPAPVPFIAYETSLASEREHSRRLFWLVVALIIALVATNLSWLYVWQQYDYVSETYTQDGGGVNFICGGDGSYGAEISEEETNP